MIAAVVRRVGIMAGDPGIRAAARRCWPWVALLAFTIVLPWLFYDWSKGRHAGFVVSLLSQIGLMIIFALSFNMQMGQAGLLSFGHAVYLGLGGYVTIHAINAVGAGRLWLPMELMPLVGGFSGLLFAIVFGWMATKQRGTAYAMITLGLGELVGAAAVMFNGFFGGEGGITANRILKTSLFGLSYGPSIQVYYLILAWTAVSVVAMLLLTQVPLGRMANACRDNFERAQFVGYDPRMVRFYQCALSGFFAGIAGALYAVDYEIVTFDAVGSILSANALLMTFIGGIGVFWGPIVGAVLITLLQSWMSLISNAWLIYVAVLFIVMVIYAPGGIAGLIMAHVPIWRAGRLPALALPYLRIGPPALIGAAGFAGLVELTYFVTIGSGQGKSLSVLHQAIDAGSARPWLLASTLFVAGTGIALSQRRAFAAAWDAVGEQIRMKERSR
jgi:branched-chain amino acid transport system permease protein